MRRPPCQPVISTVEALRRVGWLGSGGEELLNLLAQQSQRVVLRDREALARRGQWIDRLVVVAEGRLELSMTAHNGKRHVVSLPGAGEVFGLIPMIDGEALIHDVQAFGPATVVRIPREALLAAMQHCPKLAMEVMRILCTRGRDSYERIGALSLMSIRARLAQELLRQSQRGHDTVLPMSQAVLAELVGVSRQSLQSVLKRMENEGLLSQSYANITLLKPSALAQLARGEAPPDLGR